MADLGPEYPCVSNPDQVSQWEHFLYRRLYRAGIRPIPQYQVEKYWLDFAVIMGDRRLNIEIDGERYHRNWDGELCRRDQIRNQRLMELGWDIMRFWVYQVRDDIETCVTRVQRWLRR
jgi:very-short-patch-repair endonuclease